MRSGYPPPLVHNGQRECEIEGEGKGQGNGEGRGGGIPDVQERERSCNALVGSSRRAHSLMCSLITCESKHVSIAA